MAAFLLNSIIDVSLMTTIPAVPTAPTQAELTGGTDLVGSETTEELVEINGWQQSVEAVPLGGYSSTVQGALAGRSSYPASFLRWRADDASETIFTAVAVSTSTQWLAFAQQGFASGNRAVIFPVTIPTREESLDENVAHTFRADFSLNAPYQATQGA